MFQSTVMKKAPGAGMTRRRKTKWQKIKLGSYNQNKSFKSWVYFWYAVDKSLFSSLYYYIIYIRNSRQLVFFAQSNVPTCMWQGIILVVKGFFFKKKKERSHVSSCDEEVPDFKSTDVLIARNLIKSKLTSTSCLE